MDFRQQRPSIRRWIVAAGLIAAAGISAAPPARAQEEQQPPTAVIGKEWAAKAERHVDDLELGQWIAQHIPADTQKLFVFTQCFAGNFAQHPAIKGLPNTAIASANAVNLRTYYGGYQDDAARALRPGPGRTARLVHQAGIEGKHPKESPFESGTLRLENFSLEDTSPSGPIRGRVVLVLAAAPTVYPEWVKHEGGFTKPIGELDPVASGTKTEFSDVADRDAIYAGFNGKYQTRVIRLGASTADTSADPARKWDQPLTPATVLAQIKAIGEQIRQANETGKWQFIVYVGDHGELLKYVKTDCPAPPGSRCSAAPDFQTLPDSPEFQQMLRRDRQNVPRFSAFVSFEGSARPLPGAGAAPAPFFAPGALTLELQRPDGATFALTKFTEQLRNPDGDSVLGNAPGEGVWLAYEVDEDEWLSRYVGVPLRVTVVNNTAGPVRVTAIEQSTGGMERAVTTRPADRSWLLVGLVVLGVVVAVVLLLPFLRRRAP